MNPEEFGGIDPIQKPGISSIDPETSPEISETTLESLIIRIKSILAREKPDLLKYFNILEKNGILQRIKEIAEQNPIKDKKFKFTNQNGYSTDNYDVVKEYLMELVQKIIPENFLQSINMELQKLQNFNLPEVSPEEKNQSLYHLLDDERLLSIVKEGFKSLKEHPKGAKSTGRLEQALGLNGIFFCFGECYEWFDIIGESNLVVYPFELACKKDSVNIHAELSYEIVFADNSGELLNLLDSLNIDFRYERNPKTITPVEFIAIIALGLTRALTQIVTPDHLEERVGYEICVNPKHLHLPQMIIVEDEPEYFYEEAEAFGSEFTKVPIISDENVKLALEQTTEKSDAEDDRSKFVELVNRGFINPMDWAVNNLAF
ncbi:hypothetical protein ACFL21_00310 [Patescibacteria group bacterium]